MNVDNERLINASEEECVRKIVAMFGVSVVGGKSRTTSKVSGGVDKRSIPTDAIIQQMRPIARTLLNASLLYYFSMYIYCIASFLCFIIHTQNPTTFNI